VNGEIQSVHAGISQGIKTLKQVARVQWPPRDSAVQKAMLWSELKADNRIARGCGCLF
jgi:hypothetical protein